MARTDDDAAVNLFDVLPTDDKMQSAIDHNSPRKPPRRYALSVAERLHADLGYPYRAEILAASLAILFMSAIAP